MLPNQRYVVQLTQKENDYQVQKNQTPNKEEAPF
jgi:hypothetical protein